MCGSYRRQVSYINLAICSPATDLLMASRLLEGGLVGVGGVMCMHGCARLRATWLEEQPHGYDLKHSVVWFCPPAKFLQFLRRRKDAVCAELVDHAVHSRRDVFANQYGEHVRGLHRFCE